MAEVDDEHDVKEEGDGFHSTSEKNFWTEIEDKKLSELVEKFKEIYGMKHVNIKIADFFIPQYFMIFIYYDKYRIGLRQQSFFQVANKWLSAYD